MKRLTRGEAIKAFCVECMGHQPQLVKECTAPDCPLYGFRLGREVLAEREDARREKQRSK
jgi:hypothetical protein